jgi:hypothetical protein
MIHLSKEKTGYGRFEITAHIDGMDYTTTTTNMQAVDAAFDEDYDDEDNSGRRYESRQEAIDALINEINQD